MTNREAIDDIMRNIYPVVGGKSLEMAVKAIERDDRYRWHDLRKNPEDVPEDFHDVFVCFEYFRYGSYNCMVTDYGIADCINHKWTGFVNGQSGWKNLKILGWKEIEPFEVEE